MFTSFEEVKKTLKAAQDEFSKAQPDYKLAREYYENVQYPTDKNGNSLVPDKYSFIVVNKSKPHANMQISKVVGGKVDKTLKGEQVQSLEYLLDSILEKNKFHEEFLEKLENYREVEGFGGIKFYYDPYEDSEFGLGFPRFDAIFCGDGALLLDPNATDGYHSDDKVRFYKKRISLKEALNRPGWKRHREAIKGLANTEKHEDKMHTDLWEIEFVEEFLIPAVFDPEQAKYVPIQEFVSVYDPSFTERVGNVDDEFTGDMTPVEGMIERAKELLERNNDEMTEEDEQEFLAELPMIRAKVYLSMKMIGMQDGVMVEEPKPTGYSGFTIIPSMHTIRMHKHKYPASDLFYLRYEQDKINVLNSMIVETVKKSLKNFTVISGVDYADEQSYILRKMGNIAEILFLRDQGANIKQITTPSIPAPLLQALDLAEKNFDNIGNTGQPDRGQPLDLSGTAIQSLQARFDIPLYVPTVHLENSLTELFRRILECLTQKMTAPFAIQREIDGKKRKIYFNTERSQIQDDINDDELFVLGKDDSGNEIVNYLAQMNVPDVGVDITTNTLVKEQEKIQKALMMTDRQLLHPEDLHKAVYPEDYAEKWAKTQEWNAGLQLAQVMAQLSDAGKEYVQNAIQEAMLSEKTVDEAGLKD